MRLALVQHGTVVNVIEADDASFIPDAGLRAIPSAQAGPGWKFDGMTFSPPPEPKTVPRSVSMFQAREAMRRRPAADGGSLLEAVDSYIDEQRLSQPTLALAWEYAVEVDRGGLLIQALAKVLGMDDAAVDDLFRLAASIRA